MSQHPIFTLFTDPLIGESFAAYAGERLGDGSVGFDLKRLTLRSLGNYSFELSEPERQLIRLADELTHESLLKGFSKKVSSLEALLKDKGPAFFKSYVRPVIEKRLHKIILLCQIHGIRLFCLNPRGFLHPEPLEMSRESAQVRYLFDWSPEGLRYSLEVSLNSKGISLQDAGTLVLTDEPAFLVHQNRLMLVDGINGNKLKPFLDKDEVLIRPETQKKYFETFVFQLLGISSVEARGFTITEMHTLPEAILTLSLDWQHEPLLVPRFRYETREIAADYEKSHLVTIDTSHHPPSFRLEHRHTAHEEGAKKLLLSLGLVEKGAAGYVIPLTPSAPADPSLRLVDFMRKNLRSLQQYPFSIRQETDINYNFAPPRLEIREQRKNDWFDLEIIIEVGEFHIPFRQIRAAIVGQEKLFVLPDGSHFVIPDAWFSELSGLALFSRQEGDRIRMHKMHHLGLTKTTQTAMDAGSSGELIRQFFSHHHELSDEQDRLLRPYQKAGVQWLYGLQQELFGGILADDMGLGKTVQVLSCLNILLSGQERTCSVEDTALIVVPVSLLHNWENEMRKFTPELRVYRMTGSGRQTGDWHLGQFDVVLTTYGILRNDIGMLQQYPFRYLVLDESQAIKNTGSQIHRAVRLIQARHRIAMTGTPVENSITDLWAQLSVVNPGLLGTEGWFRKKFLSGNGQQVAEEKQEMLRKIVRPFILRRTKEAVAPDLPQVNAQVLYCDPTEEQWAAYEKSKSEVRNFLLDQQQAGAGRKSSILILRSLMRLRLIANHPSLSLDDYAGDSGKTTEILNRIDQVVQNNNKVLVFSQFVKHLDLVGAELAKSGIPFIRLTGQDDSKTREANIKAFETQPELQVFLISLKAGGTGLNLTAADYVFLLDPWWNPAVEEQAISRAHRIGQTKPVFVYRFITTGTLEEKILRLQEQKQQTADLFVNQNALNVSDPGQVLTLLEK